jgi:hypothetical protein
MEIQKLSPSSIRIKGSGASVVVDPTGKADAEIVIATLPLENVMLDKVVGKRLTISGPGEYEVGGVAVSGKQTREGIIYQITESSKILLSDSKNIPQIPDDEEYDCLVVKVTSSFKEDTLGPISRKCTVLYGDLNLADIKSENAEEPLKINLRKTQEVSGKTFLFK